MNQRRKVLVIEDEPDIFRVIRDYLTVNGYDVSVGENGGEGLRLIEAESPDFIILDLMLPDMDGIELCRRIRETCVTPILILSARGSDTDKVLGLGFGADDYMTKPFSLSELAARINAHLRRGGMSAKPKEDDALRYGRLVIDKKAYTVTLAGREVPLSAKEFELLHHLAKHNNQVFSKSQLLDAVWGYEALGDEGTITVYIRRLREKLEVDPSNPAYIRTVWGVGYKFSSDDVR